MHETIPVHRFPNSWHVRESVLRFPDSYFVYTGDMIDKTIVEE